MPVRTIKLKLIVPRNSSPDSVRRRRALWATHAFVNEAAAYYQRLLLEMRQAAVCVGRDAAGKDLLEGAEVWRKRLRDRLDRSGHGSATIEAALPHLRSLYELLVPSSVDPDAGPTRNARQYHSLLVDSRSQGGAQRTAHLDLWRPVLALLSHDRDVWAPRVEQLLRDHPDLARPTGHPPTWLQRRISGDPGWLDALKLALERQEREESGRDADVLRALRAAQILPLACPYSLGRVEGSSALNSFERTAFALAVAHLDSWEQACHQARERHAARSAEVERWGERYGTSHAAALHAIRRWEAQRAEELRTEAFWAPGSVYRLRPRELRGWERLREWLKQHPDSSDADRLEHVHALQAELGRAFGSELALRWLAERDQQWLVDHPEGDVVTRIALLNLRVGILERTRPNPVCTFADARRHPRFSAFDPRSNNAPRFILEGAGGRLRLAFDLLVPEGATMRRERFDFDIAPSGQLRDARVETGAGKRRRVVFLGQDGTEIAGELGQSTLLLERSHLERASAPVLEAGGLGAVYLSLALHLGEGCSRECRAARAWLSSAIGTRLGKDSPLSPGYRVLSVDLGLRSAAALSVFELGAETAAKSSPRPLAGEDHVPGAPGLTIRHTRSALLRLPGEDPTRVDLARRDTARAALFEVRAALTHLQAFRRACVAVEPQSRARALDVLGQPVSWRSTPAVRTSPEDLATLRAGLGLEADGWRALSHGIYRRLEVALGRHIRTWRRASKARPIQALGGKSAWAVEQLELTRKILLRWHRHHPPWREEVRRLDRASMGSVASRLLNHIAALKQDRVRTTADLIVQAARGMVYVDGSWQRRHAPVDIIVLEDLSRYLFRSDRPRAENSLLMRWSHREIDAAVEMQAEVYGIPVARTSAAFSSRFDAGTRAPGIRCMPLTAEMASRLSAGESPALAAESERLGLDPEQLQVGDLLPTGRGELLVSLDGPGLRIRHADLTAAQNIGRSYLEAHVRPVRLTAHRVPLADGREAYLTASLSKRLAGALGGAVIALRAAPGSDIRFESAAFRSTKDAARTLGFTAALKLKPDREDFTPGADDEDLELAAAEESELELAGERRTFFRDPSGSLYAGDWVEARVFWSAVRAQVLERLIAAGKLHGSHSTPRSSTGPGRGAVAGGDVTF